MTIKILLPARYHAVGAESPIYTAERVEPRFIVTAPPQPMSLSQTDCYFLYTDKVIDRWLDIYARLQSGIGNYCKNEALTIQVLNNDAIATPIDVPKELVNSHPFVFLASTQDVQTYATTIMASARKCTESYIYPFSPLTLPTPLLFMYVNSQPTQGSSLSSCATRPSTYPALSQALPGRSRPSKWCLCLHRLTGKSSQTKPLTRRSLISCVRQHHCPM